MQYKEQLLNYLQNESNEALLEWIQSHSELDQVDILREMKILAREKAIEDSDDEEEANEIIEEFKDIDKKIDDIEDSFLEEKLAEIKLDMAEDQLEKSMQEMFKMVEGMREYVIECIVTNAANADAMRELAKVIVKFEIDSGTYDPENWRAIE
jgi:hypothetical protein